MNYELQMYARNCEAYLMTPDNIEPNELAQYLVAHSALGINDHIASLVQRYFYTNLNHHDLLKYIQLLDRLIKYSFPLPISFVNMFTCCYQQSLTNGRKSIQEQLKILRKIWTPLLNDSLIEDLRISIYQQTKIDIQDELRQQSKKFLQQYFMKQSLSYHEINQILHRKKPLRFTHAGRQILAPLPQQTQYNWNHQKKERKVAEFSGQTTHVSSQKREKIRSKREDALLILNKLRNMNNFCCKQCGKYFQMQANLQRHRDMHFEQKMNKFKQQKEKHALKSMQIGKKAARMQMNVEKWLKIDQQSSSKNNQNLVVELGKQLQLNKCCTVCKCEFDIEIVHDSFVYKNCIQVKVKVKVQDKDKANNNLQQTQVDLMHRQCYELLAQANAQ